MGGWPAAQHDGGPTRPAAALRRWCGLRWVCALLLGLAGAAVQAETDSTPAGRPESDRVAAERGAAVHVAADQAAAACPPPARPLSPEQQRSAQRQARDRGLLWRLHLNGQTGWLYGTVHVGRPAWAVPGPQVAQALREADTVALELDLTNTTVLADLGRAIAALQVRDAAHPLPAALQARLAALARADCLDTPGFDSQPPLLQAVGLGALAGRRDGLDPAFAQEFNLGRLARAAGKTLVSLETPARQLAALSPDDPAETPGLVAQLVDQIEGGQARRVLGLAAAAWDRGDLDALARHADWCACAETDADRARLRRLNDDRNPALADAITTLLGRGRRVFAAVGALHMTGPMALPTLLAQRGWRVERITWPDP